MFSISLCYSSKTGFAGGTTQTGVGLGVGEGVEGGGALMCSGAMYIACCPVFHLCEYRGQRSYIRSVTASVVVYGEAVFERAITVSQHDPSRPGCRGHLRQPIYLDNL